MNLFLKECKAIGKSIIFLVFVCAVVLFYTSQASGTEEMHVRQYYEKDKTENAFLYCPFIEPPEGAENYGAKYAEIPEKIMPKAVSSLVVDWQSNKYTVYNAFGLGRQSKLDDEKKAEIAQIVFDVTGIEAEKIYSLTYDKMMAYPDNTIFNDMDFADVIPIAVTYDEYKEKMRQVDKILGGIYGATKFQSNSSVPMTYEEKLEEYNGFMSYDRITGAYARLFCDYMGIVAALFSVFVPVAFLMRDKRAKANELIFSRDISSKKLILVRYAAMVFMMLMPFIVLSSFPSVYLIAFAFKNNMPVDIFAFLKYIVAWILPTLMTTAAVALIITTITDGPLALAVQFIWSFISLTLGGFAAYNNGTGDLIYYGMNLLIRHNSLNLQFYKENLTQIALNRIFYTTLSLALVVLTIYIYEQKRKGEFDVRGSLRKVFGNRKKAD